MNDPVEPDERCVSWKVLLPVGPESRICAIGLDERGLVGLTRSYGNVDTKPNELAQYDAVIVGDKTDGNSYDLCNLISWVKPDVVVVNTSQKGITKWLNDAGFKYSRHYAALPAGKPKLFIPLASRKLRDKGLAFHSPGSFKARAGISVAKGLNLIGVKRHLMKHIIGIYASDKNVFNRQSLIAWLSEKLGYPVIDLVIFAGSESPRRKITALAIAGRQGKDVVVKIADSELGAEAIKQESQALRALQDSPLSGQVPKLIWEGLWDSYYIQLQEKAIGVGCKQTASLTNAHLEFLSKLSTIGRKIIPLKETRTWESMKALADVASSKALPQPVHVALEKALSDEFAGVPVVCHRTHGDFAPWNVKMHKGKLFVYDWEDSLPDGSALTDIFHFMYRQASLVGPWPGVQTLLKGMNYVSKRFLHMARYGTNEIDAILTIWLLSEYSSKPSDFISDMLDVALGSNK